MGGLQTVKLTIAGSLITLIGYNAALVQECQQILERHFSGNDEGELPETLGPFQMAAALADDAENSSDPISPQAEYLSPSIQYYPVEIETNAAVFTDEIDRCHFSPTSPEVRSDFAPIIADVRSLNPSHHGGSSPNRSSPNGVIWLDVDEDPLGTSLKLEPGDWDVRPGDSSFTCRVCGQFVTQAKRAKHDRVCGVSGVNCRKCGWTLKDRNSLQVHMKDHCYTKRRKKHLSQRWRRNVYKPDVECLTPKISPFPKIGKKCALRSKVQPVGRTLRSHDAPPLLLPFDMEPNSAPDQLSKPHPATRPRDPLSLPASSVPLPLLPQRKPFVSVLSVKRFESVTSPEAAPKQSRSRRKKRQAAKSLKKVAEKKKTGRGRTGQNSDATREMNVTPDQRSVDVILTDDSSVAQVEKKGRSRSSESVEYSRFNCKDCNAGFSERRDLNLHLKEHRPKCKHCPYSFVNQSYLDIHTKIFHPETVKPADITPPEILDSFSDEEEEPRVSPVRQPVKRLASFRNGWPKEDSAFTHASSEQERFQLPAYHSYHRNPRQRLHACPFCPLRCMNTHLLRRHVAVHSSPNVVGCPVCHWIFRNKRNLAGHMLRIHGMDINSEEQIPCKCCDALLASPLRLAEHYCTVHINLALLGCGICKTVLSLAQWRTHASLHI